MIPEASGWCIWASQRTLARAGEDILPTTKNHPQSNPPGRRQRRSKEQQVPLSRTHGRLSHRAHHCHRHSKPFQASIPELRFRSFPDIDKLRAIDRFNANDKSVPMKSDNHRLAIDEIGMNYSRDGRDLLVSGKESTRRRGHADVIWVIRDGKLYDTLVGQLGTGTDVEALSDGRIVSLTGGMPNFHLGD